MFLVCNQSAPEQDGTGSVVEAIDLCALIGQDVEVALVRSLDSGRELPVNGGEVGAGDDGDADAQLEQCLQLLLERPPILLWCRPHRAVPIDGNDPEWSRELGRERKRIGSS